MFERMRLYVYPQHKKKQIANPYINNMEIALGEQFEIVHPEYRIRLPQPFRLLLGSTKADVYVLNWIESVTEGEGSSLLRGIMAILALWVLIFRRAKIVWVFHNIHPHSGETKWSLRIKKILFRKATIIVSHSKEALEYAKQFARCPVFFKNHPIEITEYGRWEGEVKDCDFYIWGNIFPYKGVAEFVSNPLCVISERKVLIVGRCVDSELSKKIKSCSKDNINFENRCADFNEVAAQCKKAKYVLFPYVGESISSSGALMDTLLMGGTPVGPNRGAFADLAEQGCCITYNDINEVFSLPTKDSQIIRLKNDDVVHFVNNNSWDAFGAWLYDIFQKGSKK